MEDNSSILDKALDRLNNPKPKPSRLCVYHVGWPAMGPDWTRTNMRWQFTVHAPTWQSARRMVVRKFVDSGAAIPPGTRLAVLIPSKAKSVLTNRPTQERVDEKIAELEELEKNPWGSSAVGMSTLLGIIGPSMAMYYWGKQHLDRSAKPSGSGDDEYRTDQHPPIDFAVEGP